MIVVFWRYAITRFCAGFFICLGSIIALLIAARFKEIAEFATLSSDGTKTALFTLYQIPFILPMAIPISALIASFLLLQNMSKSQETTTLRAAGFALRDLLAPLLFLGSFFSLVTFFFSAKIAPFCYRESVHLLYREATPSSLFLLQQKKCCKLTNTYLQLKEKEGSFIDLIFITRNPSNHRLELVTMDQLRIENELLLGNHVAIVSHIPTQNHAFDSLMIENQMSMSLNAPFLSKFFLKRSPKLNIRSLDFRLLAWASCQMGKLGRSAWTELLRRSSLSLAVFSFTLLGCAFGFESGKTISKRSVILTIFLALLLLTSYFLGKGLRFHRNISLFSFLLPHLLIWGAALFRLRRIAKGVST